MSRLVSEYALQFGLKVICTFAYWTLQLTCFQGLICYALVPAVIHHPAVHLPSQCSRTADASLHVY